MTKTYELIVLAKINTGIESDYAISQLINVTRQMVSNWKSGKSEASAVNTLKLIKAAGLSIDDALELMSEHPSGQDEKSKSSAESLYIM